MTDISMVAAGHATWNSLYTVCRWRSSRCCAVTTVWVECIRRRDGCLQLRLRGPVRRPQTIQSTSPGHSNSARRRWRTCRSRGTVRRSECNTASSTIRDCKDNNNNDKTSSTTGQNVCLGGDKNASYAQVSLEWTISSSIQPFQFRTATEIDQYCLLSSA